MPKERKKERKKVSESKLSYSGFTLVELSLVIVIIGFIVAGIVGGQSLVKQAQLRSTFAKMQEYKSAIMSFKDIYNNNALPGDFINATSYWPGVTVNGDGDRRIEGWGGPEEDLNFFEHLSFSEVIPSVFSNAPDDLIIGKNFPNTPFKNVTIYPINTDDLGGGGHVANKNVLVLAAQTTVAVAQGAAISAKNALAADSKFDDGIYNLGFIHSLTGVGSATQCINAGAYYLTTGDVISCRVQFLF